MTRVVIRRNAPTRVVTGWPRRVAKDIVLGTLAVPDLVRRPARRYIFVLGHMRAGSSLLTNILATAPEIAGYGESFTRYSSRRSLIMLAARIRLARRGRAVPEPVLLDKILHSALTPSPRVLLEAPGKFVFILRDGPRAIKSMVHEFGMTEEESLGYYTQRTADLCEFARAAAEAGAARAFVDFKELIESPGAVLGRLSSFLGLKQPLSEKYTRQAGADRAGAGDTSERIRAGTVLTTERPLTAELSAGAAEAAGAAYRESAHALRALCGGWGGGEP